MKKGNNKTLRFNTQKNASSMRAKRFAAAFSCFFVLLAGISFLLLLSYYDFNLSAIGKPVDEQLSTEPTTVEAAPVVQGTRNYLLFCRADSSNALRFAAILQADMNNLSLALTPISTEQVLSAGGCTGTMEQQLDFGGDTQLVTALEATLNIDIYRYIRSTDSSFKSMIGTLGGFVTTVPAAIDIRTETLTAIISPGEQTMTGDTALKYIRAYESQPHMQVQIIAELFEQKLTYANFNKADSYYSKLVNLVQTDISVLDFAKIKNSFEALLSDSPAVKIKTNR